MCGVLDPMCSDSKNGPYICDGPFREAESNELRVCLLHSII